MMITVLVLVIIFLLAGGLSLVYASVTFANITDGEPRIALVEQEDHSFILYQTVNGITVRVAGYDTLQEFIEAWAIPTSEEIPEEEEIEESEPEQEPENVTLGECMIAPYCDTKVPSHTLSST